jgi:hypothetical protein
MAKLLCTAKLDFVNISTSFKTVRLIQWKTKTKQSTKKYTGNKDKIKTNRERGRKKGGKEGKGGGRERERERERESARVLVCVSPKFTSRRRFTHPSMLGLPTTVGDWPIVFPPPFDSKTNSSLD